MPMLSFAEIRQNAIRFAKDWKEASRERSDAQTFWNEFFAVFGRARKVVAAFEAPVKNIKGQYEFIDLFWPGTLIAEHKSRGGELDKANAQAVHYIHNLVDAGRAEEAPQYIIISDFARISLHNLADESAPLEILLVDLHKHIRSFAFIAGYESRRLDPEDPVNFEAVEKLAHLRDQLEAANFTGHPLERFLVRVLFCLFAEDTEIFEPESFKLFLVNHTARDGSDLGAQLASLFQVLDTKTDQRDPNLAEDLAAFPYVDGDLFRETLRFPIFTSRQREALLDCARFQWAKISPAIFGSLFQAAMLPKERRQIGAHYTSERDILKLIGTLFLNDLKAKFNSVKSNKRALAEFHDKLATLKFLDPACGCGNFLVITYRELRLLELEVLKALHPKLESLLDIAALIRVNVDQMYGIEIEEWPARIAEVALWLLDHQMNQRASEIFGNHYARLPLKAAPTILVANALRTDWNTLLPNGRCSFVLGNPPFVGKKARSASQMADLELIFGDQRGAGVLDYVACWYRKAAQYIKNTPVLAAFVSTNSISQGEQPGILWPRLFRDYGIRIRFAHRTFAWTSEARGRAHVHVVIVGFGMPVDALKEIYDYDADPDRPAVSRVENISPYLVGGDNEALVERSAPLCPVPPIEFGNMPNDDGNFLLTGAQRNAILAIAPALEPVIKPFLSAKEYLHGERRWCFWLKDVSPGFLRKQSVLWERIEAVKRYRDASGRAVTRGLARQPSLFGEIRQPDSNFVLIPRHSSENRNYIPLAYFTPRHIVGDSCLFVAGAGLYHFGVLSSAMHMAWVRQVAGRLKSDYRYSNKLVYNNFPWPESITEAKRGRIEQRARAVLDARKPFVKSGATPADLYDPLAMPKSLLDAHAKLDLAVDRAYRPQPFSSDRIRFEFLFTLYERLAAPLTFPARKTKALD